MKGEKLEVMRGSGNVFRDLGMKTPTLHNSRPFWPLRSSRCSTGNT